MKASLDSIVEMKFLVMDFIKHSQNWITAYAHFQNKIIKLKGSFVKKGETID